MNFLKFLADKCMQKDRGKTQHKCEECCVELLIGFQANVPFLYPLKTSVNLWFSDVSMGSIKMEHWSDMG